MRIARDLANEELESPPNLSRAETLISQPPELQSITWIDERRRIPCQARLAAHRDQQPALPARC